MSTTSPTVDQPRLASPDEWLQARLELLREEKEFNRLRDRLTRQRQALPWVKVDQTYVFDGPWGKVDLPGLFGDRSQLIVYHFMFGPGWGEGCKSCSFVADHFNSFVVHLKARDVAFAAVSRAPLTEILPFQHRLGWTFNWVSSHDNDFNRDYHVSFTPEEMAAGTGYYNFQPQGFPVEEAPGLSVFAKNAAGEVFHTYSTYSRGLDLLIGAYNYLDLVPKGRDEAGLEFSMSWLRYHDRYGVAETTEA